VLDVIADARSGIDDFLIAEYEHFADSFWRTEELGEKRVNFFISLLTAAVAGLVVLATSESGFSDSQVQWVAFSVGVALLLLGLSTLLRMLRRNEVTDQYKRAMGLVRKTFMNRYPLEGYEPFPPTPLPRRLFSGGLAQTTALLNSMVGAATAAIAFLFTVPAGWLGVLAVCTFGLSLGAQFLLIHRRHGSRSPDDRTG
jgi:hypothetical protein